MFNFQDQVAVVTGASSGIGRAVAIALATQGTRLCLVGRNQAALEAVAAIARSNAADVLSYCADLTDDAAVVDLATKLEEHFGSVNILIHSAGIVRLGKLETTPVQDFDQQYRTNVRLPYLLTQNLLPLLVEAQGQVVFINSSVIQHIRAEVGQYAATKAALRAIADSLRAEVNAKQVRVLSVYPGRTATPQQEMILAREGKAYQPQQLMQPEDVAQAILGALALPRSAEVTDIHLRPAISFA